MEKDFWNRGRVFWVLEGKPKLVKHPSVPSLDQFVGFERQRNLLRKNTEAFLKGKPFNDVLLFGKKGTGKRSLVRAQLNLSPDLKLVQLELDSVRFLVDFLDLAHELEGKFIVLIEDLTFTDETSKEIKLLKTLLDGSVVERPKNVVFYATSNRRNLYGGRAESWEDREELYSLADRFGLKLGFTEFSKKDYLELVRKKAREAGIEFNEKLEKEALTFAADKGFSGRTAEQFIKFFPSKL